MILECEACGHTFGGPKTLAVHLDDQGLCQDPKESGLVRYQAKVWRKPSPTGAAQVYERHLPHRERIAILNRFEG